MKVAFTGHKGIPSTKGGGVENYVQNLSTRLVGKGFEVISYNRYHYADVGEQWEGVDIRYTPCWESKSFEAITHTFTSSWDALWEPKLDILHVNSVGPGLTIPFTRVAFWMKRIFTGHKTSIIFTFHSEDWHHGKWGRMAKYMLRVGALFGSLFADEVIAVSKSIRGTVRKEFHRNAIYIPNGTNFHNINSDRYIKKFGLEKEGYIVFVARLVKHKNPHVLIEAYQKMKDRYGKKLVIVGGPAHTGEYEQYLHKLAENDPEIIFTGHQSGNTLKQLFANAAIYVLPSDSEGLSISLLEAASYGVPIIVSSIPQNREVVRSYGGKVRPRSVQSLARRLEEMLEDYDTSKEKAAKLQEIVKDHYSWDTIVDKVERVYIDQYMKYAVEQPIFSYK